jgi:hypothetical protein
VAHIILGVDPGEDTGIAVGILYRPDEYVHEPSGPAYTPRMLHGWQLQIPFHAVTDYDNATAALSTAVNYAGGARQRIPGADPNLYLVIENFIITKTAMDTNATWSSEVTGMAMSTGLLLWNPLNTDGKVHIDKTQQPNGMKGLIHDNKLLQEMQITRRGDKMTQHQKDAIGHVFVFANRLSEGRISTGKGVG